MTQAHGGGIMGILIVPLLLLLGSGTEEAIVTTTIIITSDVLIIFIMLVCKLSTAQSNYPGLVSTGVRAALPPLVATVVFIHAPCHTPLQLALLCMLCWTPVNDSHISTAAEMSAGS